MFLNYQLVGYVTDMYECNSLGIHQFIKIGQHLVPNSGCLSISSG